jgi:hypothetical protein
MQRAYNLYARGLAEISASAFHAESIQNRQSFSEFRDLATVSRAFEGRQMFSELSPHCFTGQATSIGQEVGKAAQGGPAPRPIPASAVG